jgi:hypothetical protein
LEDGTIKTLQEAIRLKRHIPGALLAFANISFLFTGSEIVEKKLKEELLRKNSVLNYVSASPAGVNSITEARVIKESLPFRPDRILVIAGEMHSRSVRYIWRKVFPGTDIVIHTIPHRYEYRSGHGVWWQRHGPWVWLLANVLRQLLIRVRGLDAVAKMHHGTNSFVPKIKK